MKTSIIKPLITEKSMADVSKGKYTFIVAKDASKSLIKYAIKEKFNVTVTHVGITISKGKTKRIGTKRVEASQPAIKKATITLKKGEKIGLFEPGGEKEEKKSS